MSKVRSQCDIDNKLRYSCLRGAWRHAKANNDTFSHALAYLRVRLYGQDEHLAYMKAVFGKEETSS